MGLGLEGGSRGNVMSIMLGDLLLSMWLHFRHCLAGHGGIL